MINSHFVDMEAHKRRREQTEEYAGDATSKDNLSKRSTTIARTAMQKVKEFDENFHVAENTTWAVSNVVAKAKEADENYHIAEKATVATNGALKQVALSINFISRSMWTKR
jgi:hypothetical protein